MALAGVIPVVCHFTPRLVNNVAQEPSFVATKASRPVLIQRAGIKPVQPPQKNLQPPPLCPLLGREEFPLSCDHSANCTVGLTKPSIFALSISRASYRKRNGTFPCIAIDAWHSFGKSMH